MSTVERALQKLRDAQRQSASQAPIAEVVTGSAEDILAQRDVQPTARRRIRFDLDRLRAEGLYAIQNRKLADQYRAIKRPLLNKAADPELADEELSALVAVTSAMAGEGKTFTAINLALSLTTEKDWEVLLVDSDCHNPQLSMLLGAETQPGLLNLLKDPHASIDSLVVPTNIDGLSVLPLGERDEHAAELFSSARMTSVCRQLAKSGRRRLVIFDTSPLLLTIEAATICAQVGQVVMVVRSGRTLQHQVLEAVAKLDESKAIGLVLNYAEESTPGSGQYGSYGAPYTQAASSEVEGQAP